MIDGEFPFEVTTGLDHQINEETSDEAIVNEDDAQRENGSEEANKNEVEPTQEISEIKQDDERFPLAMVVIIILLISILLFSVWWLARRK